MTVKGASWLFGLIALVGASVPVVGGAGAAALLPKPPRAPEEDVDTRLLAQEVSRTLQLLQDRIAGGSREAFLTQKALINALDQRLMDLDPNVWTNPANVDAAGAFALSGGSPRVLRMLVEGGKVAGERQHLVIAALAYLEGRRAEAEKHLAKVRVDALRLGLRAHVRFMQASLVINADPAKTMALLDQVRLDAPGTLLDEAALRRQMLVAREMKDFARFVAVTGAYLRQFPQSVYVGNFRQRLEAALVVFDFHQNPEQFAQMTELLATLEPAAQRRMYLDAARTLVHAGKVAAALPIAGMAVKFSQDAPAELSRARLYLGAAQIVAPGRLRAGLETLGKVDRARLDARDAGLLANALSVGGAIGVHAVGASGRAASGQTARTQEQPAETPASEAVRRAGKALADVDSILYSEAAP